MNSLTARTALDALALPPGACLLVTGAAGAFGGYVVQLAAADGLRVIALTSAQDEGLVRSLGAHDVVFRGSDLARSIREITPHAVDAVADGAVLNELAYPTIRDGGQVAAVIGGGKAPGRGIRVHAVNVRTRVTDHSAITTLGHSAAAGRIALRVAATFPAQDAADAHRLLSHKGVRGRIILRW